MDRARANTASNRIENRPVIRLLQAADLCYARLYHRLEVRSACQLPRRGPAILVCNHISGLDPVLVQSTCPRLIVWMMAREYYHLPALRWIFKQVHAIPIDRGHRDLSATRKAMRALNDGHVLGIFPEGRIETEPRLLPFQTGVAMMAIKMGVRVYPAHIEGTQRGRSMLQAYLQPNHAGIAFGPAIDLSSYTSSHQDLDRATNVLQDAVLALRQIVWTASFPKNRNKIPLGGLK